MARLCVAFISQLALSVYHQVMLAMSVNGVNGVKSKTPIMDLLSYGAQEIYIRPYVICDACESKRASSSICHQCYCLYLEKENVDLKRSLIEKDKVLSRIQRLTTLFEKKCAKTLLGGGWDADAYAHEVAAGGLSVGVMLMLMLGSCTTGCL
jgi:hypothetical protein